MIERKLTRQEFNRLIKEAPDTETRNLKRILGDNAYDYFETEAQEHFGLLADRPIYWGALVSDHLFTVVNKNVKEQFSLYKFSKRKVKEWARKYGKIYATMEKVNPKNMNWTKRIGFRPIKEDKKTITYILGG